MSTESSTPQLRVLLLRKIEEYSIPSRLDSLIQQQSPILIHYPAATLHKFNELVG